MQKNKIRNICKEVLKVTDEEIKELRDIAEGQRNYIHPLKNETANRQHALGQYNDKVLDKLLELKNLLESGASIYC